MCLLALAFTEYTHTHAAYDSMHAASCVRRTAGPKCRSIVSNCVLTRAFGLAVVHACRCGEMLVVLIFDIYLVYTHIQKCCRVCCRCRACGTFGILTERVIYEPLGTQVDIRANFRFGNTIEPGITDISIKFLLSNQTPKKR